MRQFAKAFHPVISTHAGIAYATKGRVMVYDMPSPVVDSHAARVGTAQQRFAFGGVMAEAIHCKRAVAGVHEPDSVVQTIVGYYRQDRTEKFFVHDPHFRSAIGDDVKRHLPTVAAEIIVCAGHNRGALFAGVR